MPRDLLGVIGGEVDRRQRAGADIQPMVAVRPLGVGGLYTVRSYCNTEEMVVGSVAPGASYAPGAHVPVGSFKGSPERFILGAPPPGRAGISALPAEHVKSQVNFSRCPTSLTGRAYYGLFVDTALGELLIWDYLDGAYQGLFRSTPIPVGLSLSGLHLVTTLARQTGSVVCWKSRVGSNDAHCELNLVSGPVSVIDSGISTLIGPLVRGSLVSYAEPDDRLLPEANYLRMHRVNAGAFVEGGELTDPLHRYSWGSGWSTASQVLVEGFDFEQPLEDGSFVDVIAASDGVGGPTVSPTQRTVNRNGIGMSSNGTLGLRYHPAAYVGGLASGSLTSTSATGSEAALWPAAWQLADDAASCIPNATGSEAVVYPVQGPVGAAGLIRLAVQSYTGSGSCPAPILPVEPGPGGLPAVLIPRD